MGSLTGSFDYVTSANNFNLSSPAQTDWIQFPQSVTAVNRKSGGGSTFSLPILIGPGTKVWNGFSGLGVPSLTWTDGTPTASATNNVQGMAVSPTTATAGQGYSFTVPADTNTRELHVIWGSYSGIVKLVATLSDGSAADITHAPTSPGAGNSGIFHSTITYQANSAGQTLTIACTLVTPQGGDGNTWITGSWYKTTSNPSITQALTGNAATAARGSLTPARVLTGIAASGSAGDLSPVWALTGNAVAASAGSAAAGVGAALTGNESTASAGDLIAARGLTGNAGAASAGSVAPINALAGAAGTASAGSVGCIASLGLTGLSASGVCGAVVASVGGMTPLTGNAVSASAGAIDASAARSITGNAGATSVGAVAPSRALSGVEGEGSAGGVVMPGQRLDANSSAGHVGQVAASRVLAELSGVEGDASAGLVVSTPLVALTGKGATGSVSGDEFGVAAAVALSGNLASGDTGIVLPSEAATLALTSVQAPGAAGRVAAGQRLIGIDCSAVVGSVTAARPLVGNKASGDIGSVSPSAPSTVGLTGTASIGVVGGLSAGQMPSGVAYSGRRPQMWDHLVIGPQMAIFGEAVTYKSASGRVFPLLAVFTDAYLREVMFEDGSTGVTEVSAILGVQLSQFPVPPMQSDQVVVPSVNMTYVVREAPRIDGRGGAKLMLSLLSSP
ncbi:hypothetical protein B0G84_5736 [Paraburkholderia sp. BL8N3]|nr:hypothetical protein [Paraburkholderia sp. BL8N3]TCK36723.1 hypothetical protein B0G84_5736 [Paraburkholderia sp. BL8N3]